MAELIAPTVRLRESWLRSRDEWGSGVHQDGAGLRPGDDVDSPDGFAAWVRRLLSESDPAAPPPEGWVRCTYWWIVADDEVLGAIALRHELNDFLLEAGGHIGYGVRPSARRRGLASFALGRVLPHAAELGLTRVLLTCRVDNEGSRRTIERHGGELEDIRDTDLGRLRRYWITLAGG
ncbi:GNAT family N-acetyltransferase [Amorphoplanes nipponensis]|uniref:Acetyltransferase n=1 Tax=Actinoplanes nipponensis TaxID=135950 RepID=A0A919MNT5_9ACTN|nr:GNAT family N-acetyltransferase [Actinoplanes nipponensis]GIE51322.1 acetyltransferase [Actinoplanes nipponensis]